LRRKISFGWNRSIHVSGRSSMSPERKSLMLEAAGSSTRLPCENWVYLLKEYCLLVRVD
jgi:hypothetical protein